MNTRLQSLTQVAPTPFFTPVQRGFLQRMCACGTHTMGGGQCTECAKKKSGLQRKLAIGASNDPLEQEADRIAEQVMAGPVPFHARPAPPRIQRFTGQPTGQMNVAPDSVDRVLASSGRPLEPSLEHEMGQRFDHDFSQVRVHTGAAAEQSARDVNAHSYTVGHDIVFGQGQFAPGMHAGRRLIAHELTHVVQQRTATTSASRSMQPALQRKPGPPKFTKGDVVIVELPVLRMATELGGARVAAVLSRGDRLEVEGVEPQGGGAVFRVKVIDNADPAKNGKVGVVRVDWVTPAPTIPGATPVAPATTPPGSVPAPTSAPPEVTPVGLPKVTLTTLPGYEQKGDTCGAASLVSALIIWDRDNRDADQNSGSSQKANPAVASACNIILTYLTNYRTKTINGWNAKKIDGQAIYDEAVDAITKMRDKARQLGPGTNISEVEYQMIGAVLYLLWVDKGKGGLSAEAIGNIQRMLGLDSKQTETIESFGDIFRTSILRDLQPSRIAQVGWYVKQGKPNAQGEVSLGHHAFLIGRLKDGSWFLSDQGSGTELTASSRDELQVKISAASRGGSYWLFTGSLNDLSMFTVGGWTGVKLLNQRQGVENKDAAMIPVGTFLAEVDDGYTTVGDKLHSGDFVSRHYSLSEAELAAASVSMNGFSRLVVEMPKGAFSVYKVNLVSDANINVTDIDRADSAGGLLMRKEFYHAWVRLCSARACGYPSMQVY